MAGGYLNPSLRNPIACGRYQLIERIGYGGMAEVFKARLPGPNGFYKTVVVKRILPRLLDDRLVVQMFIEEARIAAAADHDNIAKVFELGRANDGKYFIVMEYISGTDMEMLLRAAEQRTLRVPIWFSVKVVSEVLEALDFVHSLVDEDGQPRNVIHRDATPSNIFVSYQGKVKLSDFGVADFAGKAPTTQAGQLKGKLAYMSPEQLNAKELDRRSDLFSMGVVLWEALTQRRLFGALSEMQAMLAICDAERAPPSKFNPDIPPALDRVVLKALEAERSRRYRTAGEFQSELLDCLHDLRPPVRSVDMTHIVKVLLGREEPDAETSKKPTTNNPAAPGASFLMQLDPSGQKRLVEEHADALESERSIPIDDLDEVEYPKSEDSADLEETYVKGIRIEDLTNATTLDEASDPTLQKEAAALRELIASRQAARRPGTEEPDLSEDATMEIPATTSHYHFYLRSPAGPPRGPMPYEKAHGQLLEAGAEGDPLSISVDQRHWMKLEDFSRLSGQDLVLEMSAPPSNVTIVGTLAQRSMPAVFGLVARDRHTGTLSIANTDSDDWYEVHLNNGHPVRVVTNVASMQLPALLVSEHMMPEANVHKLLHKVVTTGQPADEIATLAEGLRTYTRAAFMKRRLVELFRWKAAEYTFNVDLKPKTEPPFARSLLGLLPDLIQAAYETEQLQTLLGDRLGKAYEPSWRFAEALEEMELSTSDREIVDRLKGGTRIASQIKLFPEQTKRIMVHAYGLIEADLLLESLEQ